MPRSMLSQLNVFARCHSMDSDMDRMLSSRRTATSQRSRFSLTSTPTLGTHGVERSRRRARVIWTLTVTTRDARGPISHEFSTDVFRRQPDGSWTIIPFAAYEAP